jgi:predicted membrane channel-forming protein YqfA (hemolysin III family)
MLATLTAASGGIAATLGLAPELALPVAILLFVLAGVVDLLLFRSIRSGKQLGREPDLPRLLALSMVSTLLLLAGVVLLVM